MADSLGYNDMMRMQSEAVKRVQEMQRRAQSAVQRASAQRTVRTHEQDENKGEALRHSAPSTHQPIARATALPLDYLSAQPRQKAPPPEAPSAPPAPTSKSNVRPDDDTPVSPADTDRLLVIILILLLSQEEADSLLLMALGYLIM